MDLIDRQALLEVFKKEKCQKACGLMGICKVPCSTATIILECPIEPKRGECDTCGWHNACNWETLMKDWDIEHGYCAAYCGADMRGKEDD